MTMRSMVLLDLRDSYSHLVAARLLAETEPGHDTQGALCLAQEDFLIVAEKLARMVPQIVPPEHARAFPSAMAD